MRTSTAVVSLAVAMTVAALVTPLAQSRGSGKQPAQSHTGWSAYLGSADSAQFTALTQINRQRVAAGGGVDVSRPGSGTFLFNPLVADGLVFVLAGANDLVALDAATGAKVWSRPHPGAVGTRGMNYWRSADGRDRRLLYMAGGYLTAVDARPAQTDRRPSAQDGRVDLRAGLARHGPLDRRSQPAADQQSRPGVRGPRHREPAGAGARATTPIPATCTPTTCAPARCAGCSTRCRADGEPGADTWPKGARATHGGVHNWSELTIDEARGIAYVPFGTGRFDFYGGDRPGQNLFANSLVALDAQDGQAAVALPDRPPRRLGLRPAGGAEAPDDSPATAGAATWWRRRRSRASSSCSTA